MSETSRSSEKTLSKFQDLLEAHHQNVQKVRERDSRRQCYYFIVLLWVMEYLLSIDYVQPLPDMPTEISSCVKMMILYIQKIQKIVCLVQDIDDILAGKVIFSRQLQRSLDLFLKFQEDKSESWMELRKISYSITECFDFSEYSVPVMVTQDILKDLKI